MKVKNYIRENVWVWSAIGSTILWLLMGVTSKNLNMESLISNAFAASFVAMFSFGQMFVITTGRGAIDLSIAGVITLSALISMKIIDGKNENIPIAIITLIGIGVLIGFFNGILVVYLKIPAIIATMASNYILTTISLLVNKNFAVFTVAPILSAFITGKFIRINLMIYLVVLLAIIFWFLIKKTSYGYALTALGQNRSAAALAGVSVNRIEIITYIICSVIAALAGMLLSARVGGAILGMGDRYINDTIAGVVLGGTLISGGRANVVGVLFGSLFLGLVITSMQIAGLSVGAQNVVKGLLIILVLLISNQEEIKMRVVTRKNVESGMAYDN